MSLSLDATPDPPLTQTMLGRLVDHELRTPLAMVGDLVEGLDST